MEKSDPIIHDVILRDLDWARAHLENDLDLIAEIMAEDDQQRQADGTFRNKDQVLKTYQSRNRHWQIAESHSHHVKLSGELAIFLGRWRGKGVNHSQRCDYQSRFLSIYRRCSSGWKMILDQSIPEDWHP